MATPIRPLLDYVVTQAEAPQSKSASGIYLPESAKEKPKTAKVLAVGPLVKGIKVGEKVLYKSYSTTEVKVGTEEYILIKEEDILATVN